MNYYMILSGGMNIRRTPMLADNVIRQLPVNTRVEGDALSADGKWLDILLIDGMQVTEKTWIATYTTSGVLKTNPLPPTDPLPFQVGLRIVADSPLRLSRVNADGTKTEVFSADVGEYVMEFLANDSNAPFIRME